MSRSPKGKAKKPESKGAKPRKPKSSSSQSSKSDQPSGATSEPGSSKEVIPPLLDLALRRLRFDISEHNVPFVHPFEITFLDVDPKGFLEKVASELDAFQPSPCPSIVLAKADWQTRPTLLMPIRDQLVYQYLVLSMLPRVAPQLAWSERTVRFSHRLADGGADWFKERFKGWAYFDRVSLAKITAGATHVVFTDIASYYENIDIGRLLLELTAIGAEKDITDILSRCLNKWSAPRNKGIPQAFSPSHVLAEFYIDPLDRALRAESIDHLRYADDMRIFCKSELEARRALHRLSALMRERGLNLQSAKTDISDAESAKDKIQRVGNRLSRVSHDIGRRLELEDPYISPAELIEYLRSDPDDPKPEVLEEAWDEFMATYPAHFDKTIFHYLLARIGELASLQAFDGSMRILIDRAEETAHVLKYLTRVKDTLEPTHYDHLARVLTADDTLYDEQRYLILKWFVEQDVANEAVRIFSRRAVASPATPRVVRPYVASYLGQHGERPQDIDILIRTLNASIDPVERATLLYALRTAPKARIGEIYGRAVGEGDLVDRAIRAAKEKK